jgi:hypothetical protein
LPAPAVRRCPARPSSFAASILPLPCSGSEADGLEARFRVSFALGVNFRGGGLDRREIVGRKSNVGGPEVLLQTMPFCAADPRR